METNGNALPPTVEFHLPIVKITGGCTKEIPPRDPPPPVLGNEHPDPISGNNGGPYPQLKKLSPNGIHVYAYIYPSQDRMHNPGVNEALQRGEYNSLLSAVPATWKELVQAGELADNSG